jgi:hypothetical protein
LALEGVDNVQRSDSLSLGVLGVGDSITNDALEEGLEDTTGLFVDQGRDTLDTTTTSKTPDGGFRDTLDVVTQDLAMTLGTTLAESFAAFATCEEDEYMWKSKWLRVKTTYVQTCLIDGLEERKVVKCLWRL